jgi:tetratricopeptide (TPR) repeat protein
MSGHERDRFELKRLTAASIPAAIERAERYRLLNEPALAESICLDVLAVDPENARTLVLLLLAVTDQFSESIRLKLEQAKELLDRLPDPYQKAYYAGIICEREARASLSRAAHGAGSAAYERLRDAMQLYEEAERIRPPGNDEALFRWNTCARTIMSEHLEPASVDDSTFMLE